MAPPIAEPSRAAAARRGRNLEYFTIAWNSAEGLLSIAAGILAGSIALVGFGLDSFVEVTSGAALLWRMAVDQDEHQRERNEKRALHIVGVCFVALALYVAADAIKTVVTRAAPERSALGIAIAAASLIVMPLLARSKRRVASELSSAAMRADSRQTDFCTYLSAILLGGLGANWLLGWWWADPAAALLIAVEGVRALRGEACDDCG